MPARARRDKDCTGDSGAARRRSSRSQWRGLLRGFEYMQSRRSYRSIPLLLMCAALSLAPILLAGCGLTEETGASQSTSTRPKNDRVKTTSDDWIVGRLQIDSFKLKSPHLGEMVLKRSEVREIRFEKDTDSVRTRFGDVLKGKLEIEKYPFKAEIGRETTFQRKDLKLIELAN